MQHQLEACGAFESMRLRGEVIGDFVLGFGDELGGCRWCWGAKIGNEIGDGEVGFVADGGDDGELGGDDGSGYALGIEGGEVFK